MCLPAMTSARGERGTREEEKESGIKQNIGHFPLLRA